MTTDAPETATENEDNGNIDPGNANVGDLSGSIYDRIDALVADLPDDEAVEAATDSAPPTPAAAAPAASAAAPAAEAEKAPEAKPAPEPDRANERLAAREKAAAERENALKEREKALATLGSKMRRGEFADVFKELGLDDREIPLVIRSAMASQLPEDKRPAQYKQFAEKLQDEDRYRAMSQAALEEARAAREELKQYQEAAAAQQEVAKYQHEVEQYLGNGVANDAPTFAKLLQADRSEALKRLYAVVQSDAQAKAARGAGDVMTPAEAAKAVEAELSKIATLLGATNSTPATKTAVARPSLSTRAVSPTRTPSAPGDDSIAIEKRVDDWLRSNL